MNISEAKPGVRVRLHSGRDAGTIEQVHYGLPRRILVRWDTGTLGSWPVHALALLAEDDTYLVTVGRDLRYARELLQRAGIAYTERSWQPGIRAISVPNGSDVSSVFGRGGLDVESDTPMALDAEAWEGE